MGLRVVADTNVYVSIFQFGGPISQILELALDRTIDLFVSVPIAIELRGVLAEKFHWSAERIEQLTQALAFLCHSVTPQEAVRAAADPEDDRILEYALAASADVIVSGDSHLLDLKSFRGIPIMSPRQFLDSAPWTT